jgi:hypothetical protein
VAEVLPRSSSWSALRAFGDHLCEGEVDASVPVVALPTEDGRRGRPPPGNLELNPGPHLYQGSPPGIVSPRIAPTTWADDVPLETVTNRSAPMDCGPNVDQARDA